MTAKIAGSLRQLAILKCECEIFMLKWRKTGKFLKVTQKNIEKQPAFHIFA